MDLLQLLLSGLCVLLALYLLWLILRNRELDDPAFYGLVLLEVGVVVQLVLGLVRLAGPHDGVNAAAYVGYLVGGLLIVPAGFVWALAEKGRAGVGVLLVAVVVMPVLFLRLHDLWSVARA